MNFAVRAAAPPDPLIRPNAILATHPALLATIEARETRVEAIVRAAIGRIALSTGPSRVEIAAEIHEDLPAIHVDEDRLRQILVNLHDNAVKFSKDGGRVSVSAQPGSRDDVVTRIADHGVGILEHDIPMRSSPSSRFRMSWPARMAASGSACRLQSP